MQKGLEFMIMDPHGSFFVLAPKLRAVNLPHYLGDRIGAFPIIRNPHLHVFADLRGCITHHRAGADVLHRGLVLE